MSNLLVRGIDETFVQALRERAAKHGRSAEAEHRAILAAALRRPKKRSFAEVLATIPNAGTDEDFARINDTPDNQGAPGTVNLFSRRASAGS